ncbi:MAG TPA: M1 family aminopeptidase, partial [Bryobacteraceae bacterium]|nr:M1 family aminopeptidase [Bryobacteraceae bacterium]
MLCTCSVFIVPLAAAGPASDFARALDQAGLDTEACYRVRDLAFQKDDLRFYFNEGQIIFSKPVAGKRHAAVFSAAVPGGDAELLLFPPQRSERLSLSMFAKTPNLNEHFSAAVFVWTDGTGEELLRRIEASNPKKLPEAGVLLASQYSDTVRNFQRSYEVRLVQDQFSDAPDTGFFYGALSGKIVGNFDVIYDPRTRDTIAAGQLVFRDNRQYFDVWTSFPARRFRTGGQQRPLTGSATSQVTIDAALEPGTLAMNVKTQLRVSAKRATRALSFELARSMKITEATLDDQPVEVFTRDSLRANLARGENDLVLVVTSTPLQPGREYTLRFRHEGTVVRPAGNDVYFVGSRTSWYPSRDAEFATYEMTFRHPKALHLVATGELVNEKVEGEVRTVSYRTSTPIRFAGFNLGDYRRVTSERAGIRLDVYANRRVEAALQPRPRDLMVVPTTPFPGRGQSRRNEVVPLPMPGPAPDGGSRLQELRDDLASALDFMVATLGLPPSKTLTVSPIPGVFGQGFPGLIYLSTLAYLNPADRPPGWQSESSRVFFSELLHAHELAHQWWGNLVTSGSHQDDWLMEALANYTALMVLEKRKGRRALDTVLASYRTNLLEEIDERPLESAGPIVWGPRLISSRFPAAWRVITYEKGSWIVHMLRAQLGDTAFLKMLGALVEKKRYEAVTTEEFRSIAAGFADKRSEDPALELFFENWVYATGIPSLKLNYSVSGTGGKVRVKGSVQQSGAGEDFAAMIPVGVQLPGKRT